MCLSRVVQYTTAACGVGVSLAGMIWGGLSGGLVGGYLLVQSGVVALFAHLLNGRAYELELKIQETTRNNARLESAVKEYESITKRQQEAVSVQIEQNERLQHEIDHLQTQTEGLTTLVGETETQLVFFRQENDRLKVQVCNLNELQVRSVKMIQNLALYGDQCEEFGRSLSTITGDLQETDNSLGLTAHEMKQQVKALSAVTNALQANALQAGHTGLNTTR